MCWCQKQFLWRKCCAGGKSSSCDASTVLVAKAVLMAQVLCWCQKQFLWRNTVQVSKAVLMTYANTVLVSKAVLMTRIKCVIDLYSHSEYNRLSSSFLSSSFFSETPNSNIRAIWRSSLDDLQGLKEVVPGKLSAELINVGECWRWCKRRDTGT